MMVNECKKWNITATKLYRNFINIKHEYQIYYNLKKKYGMAKMLENSNIELIGRHHSGIDDCKNIARILIYLISKGHQIHNTFNVKKKNI
jgi:inhibitor of KinA sporulation pathway (predicted exonuclease)